MNKLGFSLVIMVFFGLISGNAWSEGADASDLADPQTVVGFSRWLWTIVIVSGLIGLGVFQFMHKRFLPHDIIVPLPVSLLVAGFLLLIPPYFDNNIYGWFGRDCFQDYIVSGDRVVAKGERPIECAEAREGIEALGISFVIRHYKNSFLDNSYLTTLEIEFVYALMLTLWTLSLTVLLLWVYRSVNFK